MQSLWGATASVAPSLPELKGPLRAEVLIIGAGYTGLSAALYLCESGADVVVLEAAALGDCGSGLNGGQVIGGVKNDTDTHGRQRGAQVELLDRSAVSRLIGSQRYCGGWLDRRGGTVQPLSYLFGLASAVQRMGGRIFAGSPATRLESAGAQWRVHTPGGEVSASTVVLATNAYTDQLVDALRTAVVAVPSFQVASEPLPQALRDSI